MGFQEVYRPGALEMYCSGLGNLPEKSVCPDKSYSVAITLMRLAFSKSSLPVLSVICGIGQITGTKQPADVSLLSDAPLEEKHVGYNVIVKA